MPVRSIIDGQKTNHDRLSYAAIVYLNGRAGFGIDLNALNAYDAQCLFVLQREFDGYSTESGDASDTPRLPQKAAQTSVRVAQVQARQQGGKKAHKRY